jgi:hypothetical protein
MATCKYSTQHQSETWNARSESPSPPPHALPKGREQSDVHLRNGEEMVGACGLGAQRLNGLRDLGIQILGICRNI